MCIMDGGKKVIKKYYCIIIIFFQWVMCFGLMAVGVKIIGFVYVFDAWIMKKHKKKPA